MRDVNLYICRLYLDKMKRFFSFFILSLFLSAVNLFAQTEPIAHLVVDQSSIEEDGGSTKLRVNLKDASENEMNATVVTNIVITISGSATLNTDYSITNATNSDEKIITIPVGASSGFLTINAINDSDVEPEENIIAEISSINVGSIHAVNNDRTIKILDDDLLISLKLHAGDTFLLEEASPKTVLRAEINQAVSEDIEVQVGMTGGDAVNADVNFTGIVQINDGDTFSDFEIYAIDDNVYESTETFYLKFTNVKSGPGRMVNDSIGFSITDNDPPKVSFTIDKTEIDEDGGTATLTITLSRVYDKPSTIGLNYEGLDFKAEKDIDFSSNASDQITIAAGNTTAQLTITAIDDNIQDPNENIVIESFASERIILWQF